MDRSVDSIGSCSLDVDADSSDISDTSGSLNFPTPLSVKDITREFTANIRERCSVRTVQNSTALVDPATGQVRMVLTQPTTSNNSSSGATIEPSSALPLTPVDAQPDKKPSYLNLACCVNGYSNLTTYDSKIRQDINKSREVSPIRPSSNSLQYCKRNNALAPPILHTMPNVSVTNGGGALPHTKQPTATGHKYVETNNNSTNNNNDSSTANNSSNQQCENGTGAFVVLGEGGEERRHTSFIQQRVERLYGPGALAQGFYSPKKSRGSHSIRAVTTQVEVEHVTVTELSRKFQELSPSKDYSEFRKKLGANGAPSLTRYTATSNTIEQTGNNSIDLPVLRHLSQEFRAQLPTISPKRNFIRSSPGRDANANNNAPQYGSDDTKPTTEIPPQTATTAIAIATRSIQHDDEVDHKLLVASNVQDVLVSVPVPVAALGISIKAGVPVHATQLSDTVPLPVQHSDNSTSCNSVLQQAAPIATTSNGLLEKDGNFFLNLLKNEQIRLLALASDAEKYIEALSNNPDITEDTMGFLRAASGKARLLVSQKMKQFEGLCHNNLNRSPEDKFPTTVDDLQGFWDMVYLQIDHIDSIFEEIEVLKSNDWRKPNNDTSTTSSLSSSTTAIITKTQKLIKTRNAKPKATASASATVLGTSVRSSGKSTMSAAALKREAQRKQLLEMKRKNKIAMAAATASSSTDVVESSTANGDANSIEIFVDEKSS